MASKQFPKTWPPLVIREFLNIEQSYRFIRDLVKSLDDFRRKTLEVDSTKGHPAFSAYLGTNQTGVSLTTWTKVDIDTEEFDTDGEFNVATGIFSPTIPGLYLFTGAIQFLDIANAKAFASSVFKNTGSLRKIGNSIDVGAQTSTGVAGVSALFTADGVNDTFQLQAFQTDSASEDIVSGASVTWFQGFRVGALP